MVPRYLRFPGLAMPSCLVMIKFVNSHAIINVRAGLNSIRWRVNHVVPSLGSTVKSSTGEEIGAIVLNDHAVIY